ncbi:methyl-accepting chemotaxis protein [Methylobacterium sp. CM6247]
MGIQVKHLLVGLITLLMVAIAGQGGMALMQLQTVNANAVDLAESWLPSVRGLGDIKYRITRLRLLDARYVSLLEPTSELDALSVKRLKDVEVAARSYEPFITSADEKALYETFKSNWSTYLTMRANLVALVAGREQAPLIQNFSASRVPFEKALGAIDQNSELNTQGGNKAQTEAGRTYRQALWVSSLLCIAVLLCGLGAIVFVIGGVTKPITGLIGRMRTLADGDLETQIPYLGRKNEIGAIAAAVEASRDNLLRTRQLEAETAHARLAAEEQRKTGMRQMADAFETAVGGIIGSVSSSATELQATAQQLTSTASQTAGQSATVAAAAEEAAANVNTVASAAEELGVSVQEISRQVSGSSDLAQRTVGEADRTAALVQELSDAVARIGDVVQLISTIAGQTNLLALNATIEAARAGEAGRGFAVVASEVKELANQTARATSEISEQISRIQGATGQAVDAIGSITTRIKEINMVATTIASAVEQQGAATQEIVRNVAEASTGTSEVTSNISGVAQASQEAKAAANQVLGSASELSRQSEYLSAEVQRFLSTVRAA